MAPSPFPTGCDEKGFSTFGISALMIGVDTLYPECGVVFRLKCSEGRDQTQRRNLWNDGDFDFSARMYFRYFVRHSRKRVGRNRRVTNGDNSVLKLTKTASQRQPTGTPRGGGDPKNFGLQNSPIRCAVGSATGTDRLQGGKSSSGMVHETLVEEKHGAMKDRQVGHTERNQFDKAGTVVHPRTVD
ncbi:hypothetical protein Bbelb_060430 [Branchiostoma belcheri]|nr:hypothetical protein Bbelb_060430 [Branchiostoma belcheri]